MNETNFALQLTTGIDLLSGSINYNIKSSQGFNPNLHVRPLMSRPAGSPDKEDWSRETRMSNLIRRYFMKVTLYTIDYSMLMRSVAHPNNSKICFENIFRNEQWSALFIQN